MQFSVVSLSLFVVAALFQCSRGDAVQVLENVCGGNGLSPYLIVIDGGSTGSRLHIFEFSESAEEGSCVCSRKGSSRANVPLSAFNAVDALDPDEVAAHMLPLFEFASSIIPPAYHNNTIAKYQATAGMRLLSEEQQGKVYDALYEGLMASESFVFRGFERDDIATLSGDLEGYYGAVAANYLSGIIDTNLQVVSAESNERRDVGHEIGSTNHPIGALDMGGSSTQIVYLAKQVHDGSQNGSSPSFGQGNAEAVTNNGDPLAAEDNEQYPQTCNLQEQQGKRTLQGDDFFSTSYLGMGVDQFRERLWNTLIYDRYDEYAEHSSESCETKIVEYPCGFRGHQIEWEGYTLVGTGDTEECVRQVQRLLPHAEEATDDPHRHVGKRVAGIEHPPIAGKFFAMSLYFFALDSLRVLSSHEGLNSAWPQPSIEELADALEGLCSRSWKGDLETIQDDAHEFTRAEVLPHRCFESVYMVILLRDGFGFEDSSRDITFTYLVDGNEVEWSLGMALELRSSEEPLKQEVDTTCHRMETNNTSTAVHGDRAELPDNLLSLATMVASSG